MSTPVLFGATYSVYVRAARLALEEKGVPYRLEEVDIFADGGPPPGYAQRHPFLRIPAFEHGGFRLYEAGAIMRYVDDAFDGPPLMPATPRARAGQPNRQHPRQLCLPLLGLGHLRRERRAVGGRGQGRQGPAARGDLPHGDRGADRARRLFPRCRAMPRRSPRRADDRHLAPRAGRRDAARRPSALAGVVAPHERAPQHDRDTTARESRVRRTRRSGNLKTR